MATSPFCQNNPSVIPTGTLTLLINCPSPGQRGERTMSIYLSLGYQWAERCLGSQPALSHLQHAWPTNLIRLQQRNPSQLLFSTQHSYSWKLWVFCSAKCFVARESLWPPTLHSNAQTSQEALHKQLGTMCWDAAVFLHDKFIMVWPQLMLMYSEEGRERERDSSQLH